MTSDPVVPRVTVRQLLEVPRFRLRLVAGAEGLDRPIRWAHSTELLDPGPYLRGHEIVLTVGASLEGAGACAAFADSVKAGRGGAIGYGVGDVTDATPGELLRACDRLGLPLLEVPAEVPFIGFTEWFAERLASTRAERHDREETGRLLRMVQQGLASPEALRTRIDDAGLDPASLLVIAMDGTEDELPGVLGLDGDTALLVTNDAHAWSEPAGIGSPGPLEHLPLSVTESLAALEAARRGGGVVHASDLATFKALLGRLDPAQLAPFAEQIARPLGDYDSAHGTRLVETLRTFLDMGGAVGATSRALFLHPNTLRHRLGRIEALTGRDPLRFDDRVALAIAVWAAAQRGGSA
ncbi:PucR family transcriptional regulator [Actinomadura darangshiensis]|uniref:PucR family transcriptional regulator n=1 Tax=Actinomadura darangshiensis TaxID=705336 RepID=A0A4R5B5K1_9ACTN|nr:PucR family transcriptional regulator [Actinomadura darangshiensis]TDD80089.1 PucR family transcriptional regulator [Actinomadura darangshiensis]